MTDATIALVSGANTGIGLAAARRLAEQGWTVLLGSCDPDRGAAAAAELGDLDVRVVARNVGSETSVSAAASWWTPTTAGWMSWSTMPGLAVGR